MRIWRLAAFLGLIAVLGLAGCGGGLMPTPTLITDGGLNPFYNVAEDRKGSSLPVFVACPREYSERREGIKAYTNKRSRDVRLGKATVEIVPEVTWDELVADSTTDKRSRKLKPEVAEFEDYGTLWATAWPPAVRFDPEWKGEGLDRAPADRFLEEIQERLDSSRRRQILIYVHGFNTKLKGNLEIAAGFLHFMGRDPVVINFDWPSKGSLFSYQEDKATAETAERQFRELLRFLAENTTVERINILAHSAGNPVVIESLRHLSLMTRGMDPEEARAWTKIGRVVLAAPDMDLDAALGAAVDGALRITQGVALYASKRDKALGFSSGIFGDVRLGASIGRLSDYERQAVIANDAQWIDATRAQKRKSKTFTGHSYYHANPWVSSDIMVFLAIGATPEERGLVRNMETGFLEFPEDYEERLPEIAKRLEAYLGSSE